MRQDGVILERGFTPPVRINEEKSGVPNRSNSVYAQASRLRARGSHVVLDRSRHGDLVAGARVKSRENEPLHPVPLRGCLCYRPTFTGYASSAPARASFRAMEGSLGHRKRARGLPPNCAEAPGGQGNRDGKAPPTRDHSVFGLRLRRAVATLMLATVTDGCVSWKGVRKEALSKEFQDRRPSVIQVVHSDSVYELHHPSFRADTLQGIVSATRGGQTMSFALDAVDSVEVKRASRTPVIIVGGVLVAVGTAFVALANRPKRQQ